MKWLSPLLANAVFPVALLAQTPGTVLTLHAPEISGTVEGSIHQMLGEPVTLTGSAIVSGDLLVPGEPQVRVSGSPTYGGVSPGSGSGAPSNYEVVIGGNTQLRYLRTRTNPVALPAVAPPTAPNGTRALTLTAANQLAGDFATLRDLTLQGGSGIVAVPPGAYGVFAANASRAGFAFGVAGATQPAHYHFQQLALSGNTELRVLGPVIVTVQNGVSLGGVAGSMDHGGWLELRVSSGGLALQGNAEFRGVVQAPAGAVELGGTSRLSGAVAADRVKLGSGTVLRALSFNRPPTVILTQPASGATFVATSNITLAADASDPDGAVSKVEFFAGTTKIGEATASPFAITWANVPAGSYVLQAVALDAAGATAVSNQVGIDVTPGQPPSVTLTTPTAGATFVSSLPIALAAMASDPDGTIARVEFFQGTMKIGEAFNSLFIASWLAVPGSYVLTAKAYDNVGLSAESASVAISVRAGLPYVTDFEALEGYALGPLAGQQTWVVPQGMALVSNSAAYSKAWSVTLAPGAPPAQIGQSFVPLPGQDVVFVDFFAQSVADVNVDAASVHESESARVSLLRDGASGIIHVFDGNGQGSGTWQSTGVARPLSADGTSVNWLRFTLRQDYSTKRWDLFADATLVAINLGFRDHAQTSFTAFGVRGHALATTRLDYLFAGTENPVFDDLDRDGIDDVYEAANGMNARTNDRDGDVDGDGLSNIAEFMLGTRANMADTDGDTMPDGWEVKYGLNPKVADGAADTDGDGVSNAAEFAQGRNPTKGAVPDTTGTVGLVVFQPL